MPTWFITGCSSGFGLEIAKAAIAEGDKVAATSRDATKLGELKKLGALVLSLDITASTKEINKVVNKAVDTFGSIDILINNAGYVLEGAVEEVSDEEAKAQFEVNVFAQMAVSRAVLPHMRAQKSGVIGNMGSGLGWKGSIGCGWYSATKFAMAGLSESLRDEVAHLGIQVVLIEPGHFRTDFLSAGHRVKAKIVIDDLKPALDPLRGIFNAYDHHQPGDPVKGAKLIVDALTGRGQCKGKVLPLRLAIGTDSVAIVQGVLDQSKKSLDEWSELSVTTDYA